MNQFLITAVAGDLASLGNKRRRQDSDPNPDPPLAPPHGGLFVPSLFRNNFRRIWRGFCQTRWIGLSRKAAIFGEFSGPERNLAHRANQAFA
ncbi:MAG: hypothetical protein K9N23_15180 [Akkermansiaceae bacterium]|nr:hypothetical protein [Akkermansiaceae bacterium]MCF7733030.1 hypothetical protein [Akkermansiaceae bacterium]